MTKIDQKLNFWLTFYLHNIFFDKFDIYLLNIFPFFQIWTHFWALLTQFLKIHHENYAVAKNRRAQ